MAIFIFIVIIVFAFLLFAISYNKKVKVTLNDQQIKKLLSVNVQFYRNLNDEDKALFAQRILSFLERVRITGIQTQVEDIDKVFIAAGAIIPVFHFKKWKYRNVHEVLLYPNSFSEKYDLQGNDRNILGQVGTGPMQNVMILSQPELREGFTKNDSTSNTAIHEFSHLIDKEDGATDGIPEVFMQYKYCIPWLNKIKDEMKLIASGKSDINPYALTNDAEFFAVVSEYFFKQPELLKERHKDLFELLELVFEEEKGDTPKIKS